MPTATELLSTEACDDILVVDLESRSIIIPKNVSVLGVEADDETRILHFQLPRYYCNVDLSEFAIRVNYKNANGEPDMYIVTDTMIEDDLIKFDWIVGRHAFAKKGNVRFSVCLKDLFEGVVRREFNTTIATLPVLEGLETGSELVSEHTDIFEQLRESLSSDIGDIANTAVGEYIAAHPEDVKGPKGDAFEYEDFTPQQLEALIGPSGASIQSIRRTSGNGSPGSTDTYTVTMTNGTTATFQVYNGKDGSAGSGSGDMLASMYDPQNKRRDIFQYIDDAVGNIELPDDVGDMQASTYDPQNKKQDIFKYVDDGLDAKISKRVKITSGDITDLYGMHSNRYSIENVVTGMPEDGYWWFMDSFASSTDVTFVAYKIDTVPELYIRSVMNGVWGSWHKVPITNANGELIMDGNIKGHYVTGEWLRTVAEDIHRTEAAEKIAVIDGSGWVYYRTPAEILSDIGAYSKTEVDNAIATAIGNAIGGSY